MAMETAAAPPKTVDPVSTAVPAPCLAAQARADVEFVLADTAWIPGTQGAAL
ncbi:hypothetical protein [Streptomyces sp. NBC_00696]|uniref:hypothetical protein n=1 Tax=Streptomyces sp. NBC_00696 TaxID=2903672 RepID=UPI002E323B51|nr:hypothetical protein [Streptomyces sp. NBC_00696]